MLTDLFICEFLFYELLEAIRCFEMAIPTFVGAEMFPTAAGLHKQIGDIYERQDDKGNALEHYHRVAEYFALGNQPVSVVNALLKAAQLSAQLERYCQRRLP
jgi:alpha-soluble NSF attachment protein